MTEQNETSILQRATENSKNLHEDFLNCCQKILNAVFSAIQKATACATKPFENCFKGIDEELTFCLLLCTIWVWIPPTLIYAIIVLTIFLIFFLPMAFVVLVKSAIFAMIGIWPALLLTIAATATTIYRQIFLWSERFLLQSQYYDKSFIDVFHFVSFIEAVVWYQIVVGEAL